MHTGIRVATGRAAGDLLLIAACGLCVSDGDEGEAAINSRDALDVEAHAEDLRSAANLQQSRAPSTFLLRS
jgi:hypothetical protein